MGVSGQSQRPVVLPPGKSSPVYIGKETGWARKPIWTLFRGENSCLCRDIHWKLFLGDVSSSVNWYMVYVVLCEMIKLKNFNGWAFNPLSSLSHHVSANITRVHSFRKLNTSPVSTSYDYYHSFSDKMEFNLSMWQIYDISNSKQWKRHLQYVRPFNNLVSSIG